MFGIDDSSSSVVRTKQTVYKPLSLTPYFVSNFPPNNIFLRLFDVLIQQYVPLMTHYNRMQ